MSHKQPYVAGCDCPRCVGKRAAQQRVRDEIKAGTWRSSRVDATGVHLHLAKLRAAGMALAQIAAAAGMHPHTVENIVYKKGRPFNHVSAATAARILAVAPCVPIIGLRRRIQALCAIGYSMAVQARHAGLVRDTLRHVLRRGKTAMPQTFESINLVYEALKDTPAPPSHSATLTLRYARVAGWVTPAAWDEDTIDDPRAKPFVPRRCREFVDEVAVERAIEARNAQNLSHVELVHAYRVLRHATGLGPTGISNRLQIPHSWTYAIARELAR